LNTEISRLSTFSHLPLVLLDAVHQEDHGPEHDCARRGENGGTPDTHISKLLRLNTTKCEKGFIDSYCSHS
jgi:hypothetical protein